ncbi:MFS transporter [Arthrobacter sp. IK3]|uniref:MFS transporter n=1 Tax=Arthrobacter sp. IK3 TaxID=3448169 RepID=UPI003EE1F4A9
MQWKLVASGLALIAATYGLARFGYGLFLPRFAEAFEMGPGLSGIIQAGSFLSYCVTALLAARLAGRPRLLVLLAGATAALGAAGVAAAPNAGVLAGAVVFAGAGAGFATPGLVSLIESNVEARRQENAQAIVNSGTGAGLVAAGALLLLVAGQWRLGWAVIAAVVMLATVATLASDRTAHPERKTPPPPRMPGLRELALLRRPLIAAGLAGASSAAVWTFGRTVLAAGTEELYSIAAWMVLGGFGMLGAAAGNIVQAWSLRTAWTTTALLMAGATLLMAAGPAAPTAGYASAAVFGASYIALSGVLIVWAVRTLPEQGAAATVFLFIALAVGQAAGSVGLGSLLQPEVPLPAFGVAAAVGLLAIAPAWVRGKASPDSRREASYGSLQR